MPHAGVPDADPVRPGRQHGQPPVGADLQAPGAGHLPGGDPGRRRHVRPHRNVGRGERQPHAGHGDLGQAEAVGADQRQRARGAAPATGSAPSRARRPDRTGGRRSRLPWRSRGWAPCSSGAGSGPSGTGTGFITLSSVPPSSTRRAVDVDQQRGGRVLPEGAACTSLRHSTTRPGAATCAATRDAACTSVVRLGEATANSTQSGPVADRVSRSALSPMRARWRSAAFSCPASTLKHGADVLRRCGTGHAGGRGVPAVDDVDDQAPAGGVGVDACGAFVPGLAGVDGGLGGRAAAGVQQPHQHRGVHVQYLAADRAEDLPGDRPAQCHPVCRLVGVDLAQQRGGQVRVHVVELLGQLLAIYRARIGRRRQARTHRALLSAPG